jgi:hypothetical protein
MHTPDLFERNEMLHVARDKDMGFAAWTMVEMGERR